MASPEYTNTTLQDTLAVLEADFFGTANTSRTGVIGHSAGAAFAVGALTNDSVLTAISLTGGSPTPSLDDRGKPVLIISAELDQVVPPAQGAELFVALTGPRRFIVLARAGHNSFTDSCPLIRAFGGLDALEPWLGAELVALGESGCTSDYLNPAFAFAALNHLATLQFRSVLYGADAPITREFAALIGISLTDYREASGEIPAEPTGLTATPSDGQISLSWDDPSDSSIIKYQYRQSTDGGGNWSPDWTDIPDSAPGGANATSFTVIGLANNTAYTFEVRAINSTGDGDSAQVGATPAV